MINPTIKIKGKKNSFNVKMKISKEEVENYLGSTEDVAELKKEVLESLALEFDSFVVEQIASENGREIATQVELALQKVVITQTEEDVVTDEEHEEEVLETEEN